MKLLYWCLPLFILGLLNCTSTGTSPQAGGINDFPNSHTSASALGKAIVDNISQGEHWADSFTLPKATSPAGIARLAIVPSIPSSQTLDYDLSDTLHGIVMAISSFGSDSDKIFESDTFFILYDDAFRDTIQNNEHLFRMKGSFTDHAAQIRSSYVFIDSDGDRIINNRDGRPNRMFAAITHSFQLRPIRISEVEIDAGADHDLATGTDMRIMQCRTFEIDGAGDTLSMVHYENHDGDSVIFDASTGDSSLVRVRLIDSDIEGRLMTAQAVYLIFPLDSLKNRTVYFQSVRFLNGGAVTRYLVRGRRADSLFFAADTAVAYYITAMPGDEEWSDSIRMDILIGKDAANANDNYLIGFYHHRTKRYVSEEEMIFSLTPDGSAAGDEALQRGAFSLKTIYDGDQWIMVDGIFTSDSISAVYKDVQQNSLHLEWDRSGEPR